MCITKTKIRETEKYREARKKNGHQVSVRIQGSVVAINKASKWKCEENEGVEKFHRCTGALPE